MDIIGMLKDGFEGSIGSILNIAKYVIPLMIFMEILKDLNILDKISEFLKPISKFLGISKESTFPLIVGLTLGLAYGAGVIIKSAKEGNLSKKDLYLVLLFLVACHSVIEDTLLFVAIGANGWLLLGIRLPVAIILTAVVARYIDKLPINLEN
ncbi:nucleoside recognition domain-containing protein [Dethiothermospora halolimnae]|uniref:nucleoside recognition domain-containing protein n=1 Tax=Dethiothermospora halolimnae TaxID=3114390 RepID=UPI003CCC1B65